MPETEFCSADNFNLGTQISLFRLLQIIDVVPTSTLPVQDFVYRLPKSTRETILQVRLPTKPFGNTREEAAGGRPSVRPGRDDAGHILIAEQCIIVRHPDTIWSNSVIT
ncbi:hypothetical protein SXANM310S_06294 [Streptomyces xanthochromogenes]